MRLYFIRHGQSLHNAHIDSTGTETFDDPDSALTETGHTQAALLAKFLATSRASGPQPEEPHRIDSKDVTGFRLTHLYCSLMDRAIATGSYLSESLELPLVGLMDIHESGRLFVDDDVRQIRVGIPGRTRNELIAAYPRLILPDEMGEGGWWNRPFEEVEERQARAKRVFTRLLEKHGSRDDRVVFLSHGGFFNWLMARIFGFERLDALWLHMNNTAITRIDFDGDSTVVQYMNRTDHLPSRLIT